MPVTGERILEVLEGVPDVRKDKIAALKKAIMEGTYQVKADDIAAKLLQELLFELALTLNNHKSKK